LAKKVMNNTLPINSEKNVLELVARVIELEYLMYMPASFPHRSGLLYKNGNARAAMWNPLIDDGDLFRLAVAAPFFDLREAILSVPQAVDESLENRCARVREAFVLNIAESVTNLESGIRVNPVDLDP
jgi:hypothetical protein